jgi:hypothetical protein
MKSITLAALVAIGAAAGSVLLAANARQEGKPNAEKEAKAAAAAEVQLPDLPGITTPDKTPRGCVDCHKNRPERNRDSRLPTLLAQWRDGTDPKILEKAKAAAGADRLLAGKHPDVAAQISIIPGDCLMCHKRDSQSAPPFAKLQHLLHLAGGKENRFLAAAQGTCTHCHKLDPKTGAWRLGSGDAK